MPIYAYHCVSCGHEFDLKQGFDASTEAPCPNCEDTARRRFVAPTVIYKGSGFYTTDYGRPKSPPSETKEKEGSSASESKSSSSSNGSSSSDSKSESTPAAAETSA